MIDLTTPSARRAELSGAGALILLLLGFALWYMATHEAPRPYGSQEPAETVPEPVLPHIIEEHEQYYDIEATYPGETPLKASAGAAADAEAVSAMERFVEDTIAEFRAQGNFENLTPEDIQIMGLSDTRKESLVMGYEEQIGTHTVSYAYTLHMDTLGAHPNTFFRTFTFDLESGEELEIGDLFLPRSDYLKRLSAIAEFELSKSLGEFVDIEYIRQGTGPEAINFQSFAIDGTNLVLLFPPYQVAPYAAGAQTVSIPLEQLRDILRPEYAPE